MIIVLDYGCGNVNAFINSFKRLNISAKVGSKIKDVEGAKKIILPGVGSFDHVMQSFNRSGLRSIVERKVIGDNIDILGVCSGMQIFASSSEEGKEKGLDWIEGSVKLFKTDKINYKTKLPHMGWNTVNPKKNLLFEKIKDDSRFYFVHSYYFNNENNEHQIAKTKYGDIFTSAVNKKNIYGVQFHPEKSHDNGQRLLYNFANLN